jgi:hypothetical protein
MKNGPDNYSGEGAWNGFLLVLTVKLIRVK